MCGYFLRQLHVDIKSNSSEVKALTVRLAGIERMEKRVDATQELLSNFEKYTSQELAVMRTELKWGLKFIEEKAREADEKNPRFPPGH